MKPGSFLVQDNIEIRKQTATVNTISNVDGGGLNLFYVCPVCGDGYISRWFKFCPMCAVSLEFISDDDMKYQSEE